VYSHGTTLSIENSTISGNTIGYAGGGLAFYGGTATITNSSISGNTAKGNFYPRGGGIVNYGTMTIDRSTVSKNEILGASGGTGAGILSGSGRTWATLMRRVFDVDVLACPRCGGRLRELAPVHDPLAVQPILAHLGRSRAPPPPGPAPPTPAALR
jgi:hypothetical protein